MPSLSRELRKLLENTVVSARQSAVAGARKALTALRVGDKESPTDPDQRALRTQLRAQGRQLGDSRQADGTQETRHLEQACAYEHWHRLLFARFLAENNLLVNPDYGVAMSLAEVQETAREQNRDWLSLASDFAQRMLLEVFRPGDPVLRLTMPPETRQELEESLAQLPSEIFTADDSLGWVYQFWQRDEKERVNKSEVKIGADELSPVTQLFTEDYMVLFLLHNTLGAWWTAKRMAEGRTYHLPGYEWTYLRLAQDGSPAAGNFDSWPTASRDLRFLDPCMGSGHFLTFALPILARMRQEEEGLSLPDAVDAVLQDNLFGLELDPRCSQIAAFNVALTAWKLIGHPHPFRALNLACSGLAISATADEWVALAKADVRLQTWMRELFRLFEKGPVLGSLMNPSNLAGGLLSSEFEDAWPLLLAAFSGERANDEEQEIAIAAKGLLTAARILNTHYTLVATNVPYLVKAKQSADLRSFCESYSPDGAADLATVFIDRCGELCSPGGTHATVSPLNWLFIKSYTAFRKRVITKQSLRLVAAIGSGATATASWDVLRALVICSRVSPKREQTVTGIETDADKDEGRARDLKEMPLATVSIGQLLDSPNCRIAVGGVTEGPRLSQYADSLQGLSTGDNPRFQGYFWEYLDLAGTWSFLQGAVSGTQFYGGRDKVVRWEGGQGALSQSEGSAIRGIQALGKRGVVISRMRLLPATLYAGSHFDINVAVIVPRDPSHVLPIWCYCASPEFSSNVRNLDKKLNVTNATLGHVPFDLRKWQLVAGEKFPQGPPRVTCDDPAQWFFDGDVLRSLHPLQVAVARLLGFRWPRQRGIETPEAMFLAPDSLIEHEDEDGIVTLSALAGEDGAAMRLRRLLESAYGPSWSAPRLGELLGDSQSLEEWIRDRFFAEHCSLFQGRPFIWHIWDGRLDGFHALVNYHKLAGPDGQGRKTLEKLIYTSLGDWISRQQAEVEGSVDGAEGRLAAAKQLKEELTRIANGQPPYDLFIRWKPLYRQPIGWEPDIDDGIRLNMRPWLHAQQYQEPGQRPKQGACILRVTPIALPLGKDRGKEQLRDSDDFPWYATSQDRMNDLHLTLEQKMSARERKKIV